MSSIKYNVISNIREEDLEKFSLEGETWKRLMGCSPYLCSSKGRIYYKGTIYYNISLDDFFKYVLHAGEDDYE